MVNEYTYEVIVINEHESVIRRSDGASIPTDPSNADYQEYLASLEPELQEVIETPETPEAE